MRGKSPRRGVRAAGLDETPALVSSWKERSSFDRRLLLNDLAEFFDCPAPDLVVVRQTNPPSLVVPSWLKGSLTWKLERINDLGGGSIYPGQQLYLP